MNSRLLITVIIALFLIGGTYLAIKWAQGYRLNLSKQAFEGTGLLVTSSDPKGASVYIDNDLKTATDQTLHLAAGNYDVRIEKDGYSPWKKKLKIENELVTPANARLFPAVPNLSALTVNSAFDPAPSPDGHKIAYKLASGSATTKYGIWVVDLNDNLLRFGSSSVLIAADTPQIKFSTAKLFWTPNSNEILAYFNDNQAYLLNANGENKPINLINAAFQLPSLIADWQQELALEKDKRLAKLPIPMQEIATTSATLLYFSPSEEKLLYTATASATIPEHLTPPLPAINFQPQTRTVTAGNMYVYDMKEDTNYLVLEKAFTDKDLSSLTTQFNLPPALPATGAKATVFPQLTTPTPTPTPTLKPAAKKIRTAVPVVLKPAAPTILDQLTTIASQYSPMYSHLPLQWYPSSNHLVYIQPNNISIMEYDGTNKVTVFPGAFVDSFVYPWPNGQKLIILTSLTNNPDILPNLYGLNLQ